ncbi:cytochrome P450 94A1-like protein [Cinnamomum micranthum f. kanehirae]|uniref:Cytochrome P450 94A1-like protein n=1 Tax=Cinnamomum micranthum f. kanehirae TaxID=337451 RepID=A0A443NMR5_9MAGN|nr:cytochrome P450 94A1-like protein [Cinnamomum micranthum f. kanehirae]
MEFFCLPALIFFLLSVLSLLLFLHTKNQSNHCIPTGIRTYPVVGTLPDFLKNRHRFLEWFLIKHPANTIAVRGPGDVGGIVTANPMNVEHILKTNFENYPKGDWITDVLHDFLGGGIFSSDGEMWKASDPFERKKITTVYQKASRY